SHMDSTPKHAEKGDVAQCPHFLGDTGLRPPCDEQSVEIAGSLLCQLLDGNAAKGRDRSRGVRYVKRLVPLSPVRNRSKIGTIRFQQDSIQRNPPRKLSQPPRI